MRRRLLALVTEADVAVTRHCPVGNRLSHALRALNARRTSPFRCGNQGVLGLSLSGNKEICYRFSWRAKRPW